MKNDKDILDKDLFTFDLVNWYQLNKRILPWRENKNPYRIWISEIMLQQTQVKTVIPYFNAFMDKFPTIESLASAEDELVLKAWEGLGYYSRARNIHTSAKMIMTDFEGVFPVNYDQILTLKGIGSYTAGAISSIAYDKAYPAVDGNVMRVMSRVLASWENIASPKTKKMFEEFIGELMTETNINPSAFNQGLMELGALICKPKNQTCAVCPVQSHCKSYKEGYDDQLPVKAAKTKQINIALVAGLLQDDAGRFLMRKRPSQGLLGDMWEFIQVEGLDLNDLSGYLFNHYDIELIPGDYLGEVKHVFTHRIWKIKVYQAIIQDNMKLPDHFIFQSRDEIKQIPVSTAHKKVLDLFNKIT